MNQLNQKILPQRRCAGIYDAKKTPTFQLNLKIRTTLPDKFKNGLICAGVSSRRGTCDGDSGAPLIIDEYVDYDTGEKKFKLVAVLHGGITQCDNSVYPAILSRIAAPETYEWILEIIERNVDFQLT